MSVTKRSRTISGKKVSYYQVEVWHESIRVATQSFDTKAAAHVWHDAEKRRAMSGTVRFKLGEVVEKYVAMHLPTVSPNTVVTVRRRLQHVTKSQLATLPMDQIDGKAIDAWMDELITSESATVSWRKSFKNELVILGQVLSWWRQTYDERFVVPIVRRHYKRAAFKYVEKRRSDYFIRAADIAPWLTQLKNLEEPVYFRLAAFQILTGCRVGEAMGLCWDSVDLEAKTVRLHRTGSTDPTSQQPTIRNQVKTTSSNRVLPIPADLLAILREVPRGQSVFRMSDGSEVEPVFNTLEWTLPKYSLVKHYYSKAFKRLGLPWSGTHITRHSWATLGLMANGGNTASVQAALGHTSPETTLKYAKVVAMLGDGTADKVASMIQVHGQSHGEPDSKPKLISIPGG